MASLSTEMIIRLDEEALEAIRRFTAALEALVRQQSSANNAPVVITEAELRAELKRQGHPSEA